MLLAVLLIPLVSLAYLLVRPSIGVKDHSEFFFGRQDFGLFHISASLLATQLGAVVILGTSEFAYTYGIYGFLYTLGISLGLIGFGLYAEKLQVMKIETIPEIFEKQYHSIILRRTASTLSIISLYGILISLIVSSRKLIYSFGIEDNKYLYIMWTALVTYTIFGGIKAVIHADTLRIIFVITIFIGTILYYCVAKSNYIIVATSQLFNCNKSINLSWVFQYVALPFFYVFIEQDMAQRFICSKNSYVSKNSGILSGVLLLLFSLIPIIFGIAARDLSNVSNETSVMMFFIKETSNSLVTISVFMAVVCTTMSAADSILCAISSNIILDFGQKQKNNLPLCRILILILSTSAIFISHYIDSILNISILSCELSICILFLPVILTYCNANLNKNFAHTSVTISILSFIIHTHYKLQITRAIFCVLVSVLSIPISQWSKHQIQGKYCKKFLV